MNQTKVVTIYADIVNYFIEHGCSVDEAIYLAKICPDLFNMSLEEIEKKVHLIYNSDVLYGVIVCNQNDLKEYLYSQPNHSNSTDRYSYVTQNFLDAFNHHTYLQAILNIQPTDTLEDKLYKMKEASFNSTGYKIK